MSHNKILASLITKLVDQQKLQLKIYMDLIIRLNQLMLFQLSKHLHLGKQTMKFMIDLQL